MKTAKFYPLVVVLLFVFNSCALLYVPDKLNTPFINDQNQITVTGSWDGSGVTGQIGYSKFKNIAFIGSVTYYNPKDTTEAYYGELSGELGVGYYKSLKSSLFFDVYTGLGISSIEGKDVVTINNSTYNYYTFSNYTKGFVQSTIGYTGDKFSLGLTGKFNYARIKYQTDYTLDLPNPLPFYDFEVAFTALAGSAPIYGNLQIGYIITNKKFAGIYFPYIINFGITLKF